MLPCFVSVLGCAAAGQVSFPSFFNEGGICRGSISLVHSAVVFFTILYLFDVFQQFDVLDFPKNSEFFSLQRSCILSPFLEKVIRSDSEAVMQMS